MKFSYGSVHFGDRYARSHPEETFNFVENWNEAPSAADRARRLRRVSGEFHLVWESIWQQRCFEVLWYGVHWLVYAVMYSA